MLIKIRFVWILENVWIHQVYVHCNTKFIHIYNIHIHYTLFVKYFIIANFKINIVYVTKYKVEYRLSVFDIQGVSKYTGGFQYDCSSKNMKQSSQLTCPLKCTTLEIQGVEIEKKKSIFAVVSGSYDCTENSFGKHFQLILSNICFVRYFFWTLQDIIGEDYVRVLSSMKAGQVWLDFQFQNLVSQRWCIWDGKLLETIFHILGWVIILEVLHVFNIKPCTRFLIFFFGSFLKKKCNHPDDAAQIMEGNFLEYVIQFVLIRRFMMTG